MPQTVGTENIVKHYNILFQENTLMKAKLETMQQGRRVEIQAAVQVVCVCARASVCVCACVCACFVCSMCNVLCTGAGRSAHLASIKCLQHNSIADLLRYYDMCPHTTMPQERDAVHLATIQRLQHRLSEELQAKTIFFNYFFPFQFL